IIVRPEQRLVPNRSLMGQADDGLEDGAEHQAAIGGGGGRASDPQVSLARASHGRAGGTLGGGKARRCEAFFGLWIGERGILHRCYQQGCGLPSTLRVAQSDGGRVSGKRNLRGAPDEHQAPSPSTNLKRLFSIDRDHPTV